MSDIQDLIHKITMDSMERGKVVERERIIKLLEETDSAFAELAVAVIKGETNGY